MFNRREFLKLNALLALLPFAIKSQVLESANDSVLLKRQIRAWQGATDADSTLIVILAPRESALNFKVNFGTFSLQSFNCEKIDFEYGEYVLYQLNLNHLDLSTEYILTIYDETYNQIQKKKFRSLDLNKSNVKIALLSCANYKKAEPQKIMCQRLFQAQPDVIYFLGDLVYANSAMDTFKGVAASPKEAYLAYSQSLLEIDLYQSDMLIPIFSIHDDHDLGKNNCNENLKNKELMLKMFRSFFPVDSRIKSFKMGPGNSFAIECFGMLTFFFDTRSFKNKRARHYLGPKQLDWIKALLAQNSLPVMLISTQQFWSYKALTESYQSTSEIEFQELIDFLKTLNQQVIFISGDVHYSQIQEIPFEKIGAYSYEITSSAFFSLSAGNLGKRSKEDGQLLYYGHPNFITLEWRQLANGELSMQASCHTIEKINYLSENIFFKK